jgi:hypothetical protein
LRVIRKSYISKHATEDQRNAVINIFSGKAKGEGPFAIFAPTYKYILEPQYVDIKKTINGKKSSFSVPGVMDVRVFQKSYYWRGARDKDTDA